MGAVRRFEPPRGPGQPWCLSVNRLLEAGRDAARRYLADARRQAEDAGNLVDAGRFRVSTDVLRAAVNYRRAAGVELL